VSTVKHKVQSIGILLVALLCASCSSSTYTQEVNNQNLSASEIQSVTYRDNRLDTSAEWVTFFTQRGYSDFDPDLKMLRVIGDMGLRAGSIVSSDGPGTGNIGFESYFPESGEYVRQATYRVCSSGELSVSTGSGTCSWHGGINSEVTMEYQVNVVKLWICNDNPDFSPTRFLDGGGHAFINSSKCDDYGGAMREYSLAEYFVDEAGQ
jgi:hypothetical protein